jgi:hypothetical protein
MSRRVATSRQFRAFHPIVAPALLNQQTTCDNGEHAKQKAVALTIKYSGPKSCTINYPDSMQELQRGQQLYARKACFYFGFCSVYAGIWSK